MAKTRPASEQLRFVSQFTGEHVLDTYMEASEKGGRAVYDLLGDLFNEITGELRTDLFQFRVDTVTDKLQVRTGDYVDPEAGWVDIISFFNFTGTFSAATPYDNFDMVEMSDGNTYLTVNLSTPTSYADEATYISAGHHLLVDVSTVYTYTQEAKDWAIKTDDTVDGTNYSAKYWATQADVLAVASNIAEIITVASNLVNINAFANTYHIAASEPAGPEVTQGDLWFDTSTNEVNTYNGSAWVSLLGGYTTDTLPEGSTNLYYTDARANAAIDARVDKTFVDALATNADTLDGEHSADIKAAALTDAIAMAVALG